MEISELSSQKMRDKTKALSYIQLSYNTKLMTLRKCYAIFKNSCIFAAVDHKV